jgi:AcrR family transcriptional regulator
MARTGRRPGPTVTREEILTAARRLFAEHGYDGTTIRGIAAAAGVNQGLVHHFFGTKEQIFVAAVDLPADPAVVIAQIATAPREEFGERFARFLLSIWGRPETRAPLLALVRSAVGNEQAASMLRDLLERVLFSRLGEATGGSRLAVSAVAGQVAGVMLMRYVIRVEPLASAAEEDVVAILAPVIQACVPAQPPAASSPVR